MLHPSINLRTSRSRERLTSERRSAIPPMLLSTSMHDRLRDSPVSGPAHNHVPEFRRASDLRASEVNP